jgi:hypothetical protein
VPSADHKPGAEVPKGLVGDIAVDAGNWENGVVGGNKGVLGLSGPSSGAASAGGRWRPKKQDIPLVLGYPGTRCGLFGSCSKPSFGEDCETSSNSAAVGPSRPPVGLGLTIAVVGTGLVRRMR